LILFIKFNASFKDKFSNPFFSSFAAAVLNNSNSEVGKISNIFLLPLLSSLVLLEFYTIFSQRTIKLIALIKNNYTGNC